MIFKQIQKLFLSLFLIVSFGAYSFWRSRTASALPLPIPQSAQDNAVTPFSSSTGGRAPVSVPSAPSSVGVIRGYFGDDGEDDVLVPVRKSVPPPTPTPATPLTPISSKIGTYKDGSYAGPASYAYTGTIQVTVIVRDSKIVEVQATDASQSRTSQQINVNALPTLKTETIQVQSANVNAVSGATYTTAAYVESLTAALLKAKA